MSTYYNNSLVYGACMAAANAMSDISGISPIKKIQEACNFCITVPNEYVAGVSNYGYELAHHFQRGIQSPDSYRNEQIDREAIDRKAADMTSRRTERVHTTTTYVNGVPVSQMVNVLYNEDAHCDELTNFLCCLCFIRALSTGPSTPSSKEGNAIKGIAILILVTIALLCSFVSSITWTSRQCTKLKESIKRTKVLRNLFDTLNDRRSAGEWTNDTNIIQLSSALSLEKKVTAINKMKVVTGSIMTIALTIITALTILGCVALAGVAGGPAVITSLIALGSIAGALLTLSLILFSVIALYKHTHNKLVVLQSCDLLNSLITDAQNRNLQRS